jgi:UDP-N-acetylglucosamine 1-carboxyvinyltransferase
MKKYIIRGGKKLQGTIKVSGAKNVITKALIAACLTEEPVVLRNVPRISDVFSLVEIIKHLGGEVSFENDVITVVAKNLNRHEIPLDLGASVRTSTMFLAPLVARLGKASVPNPGGCRIGARPIDRHIKGLEGMGIAIEYLSNDGYFHASSEQIVGGDVSFSKNSHTGTETIILAGVLAKGMTIIQNAALEPEIDDLIALLNQMGAKIVRKENRVIEIEGVQRLSGADFTISTDRNEFVTLAILSALNDGEIKITNGNLAHILEFLKYFEAAGGTYTQIDKSISFQIPEKLKPQDIITGIHPGFMTDWQGPWAILATQSEGISTIHETVYEKRFEYVEELKKMGAKIEFFKPQVANPKEFYNFDAASFENKMQGIKISGPTILHNAVLTMADLRAGATLLIASLLAMGESVIYGVEHLDRGYEKFEERLKALGADILVVNE